MLGRIQQDGLDGNTLETVNPVDKVNTCSDLDLKLSKSFDKQKETALAECVKRLAVSPTIAGTLIPTLI